MCRTISVKAIIAAVQNDLSRPLTPPPLLTPEQEQAAAARDRIQARIDAMHRRHAEPRANCGQTLTIHLRREYGGGVEDRLVRPLCGRSDCPHCWRLRLTKTLNRAADCLLGSGQGDGALRMGLLHISETTWERWEAYDKAMRRELKGDCGRLRCRRADNTVLVVCERPWSGSRPVTPAQALALTAEAIERLDPARHAYRQLGSWSVERKQKWECLARVHECIDLGEVNRQLQAEGVRARRLRHPELKALAWRTSSPEAADALLAKVCPTLPNRAVCYRGTNSDSDDSPPAAGGPSVPSLADDVTVEESRPPW
jgi:hypothetical protein